MLKSKAIVPVSSALLGVLCAAGPARAASITATLGVAFATAGDCSLTGNVLDAGSFQTADTIASYEARQGKVTGSGIASYVAGSAAPGLMATINCLPGTPWQLSITGANNNPSLVDVRSPGSGSVLFSVIPVARSVGGSPVTSFVGPVAAGTALAGTGTGAAQTVSGNYPSYQTSGAQQATRFTVPGAYMGTAIATLTY